MTEPQDILVYDEFPRSLRVQIVHIVNDGYGNPDAYSSAAEEHLQFIHDVLCREYGEFELNNAHSYRQKLTTFILYEKNVQYILDAIELIVRFMVKILPSSESFQRYGGAKITAVEAIEELNTRFKEHAVGYQYEADWIIKVDSTYMHSEVVKPTLQLLYNPKFAGANEEYLKAHEHYRHSRNKECVTECLKAFESTMKIICHEKGWAYNANDTAKALINVCLTNNLIPAYLQTQFASLRGLLESGVATIRNKVGGHGQGVVQTFADDQTARYTLNLTGSNLIYLVELSGILKDNNVQNLQNDQNYQ